MPNESRVTLVVYDITGREVTLLTNDNFTAGTYEFIWDGSAFSSGTYIYKIQTEDINGKEYLQVKKMVLTK